MLLPGIDSLRVDLSGVELDPQPVPEPATFLMIGGPLALFAVRRFRQRWREDVACTQQARTT